MEGLTQNVTPRDSVDLEATDNTGTGANAIPTGRAERSSETLVHGSEGVSHESEDREEGTWALGESTRQLQLQLRASEDRVYDLQDENRHLRLKIRRHEDTADSLEQQQEKVQLEKKRIRDLLANHERRIANLRAALESWRVDPFRLSDNLSLGEF
ncbi:hypothetical protein FGRMN_8546 [Fusarium graminum]|nr:hypothetical protein FGRMN_8546 [Fusarium graminum]